MPPTIRASDEDLDRGGRGRDDAGRDRQQDAQDQHQLAAVAVAQGAEPQDGGGQTERVADGHQVQRRLRRIERLADVGQRDVRDGQVQVGDRGDEDEREEDEPRLLRTGPGVRGCGRGRRRSCDRAGHEDLLGRRGSSPHDTGPGCRSGRSFCAARRRSWRVIRIRRTRRPSIDRSGRCHRSPTCHWRAPSASGRGPSPARDP